MTGTTKKFQGGISRMGQFLGEREICLEIYYLSSFISFFSRNLSFKKVNV